MRYTADDSPAFPVPERSSNSKRCDAWTYDAMTDGVPTDGSDDRSPRSMSTSVAERPAMEE